MYQPVIRNSYLTEIVLAQTPAVGQRIYFQDVPQIRNVYTVGIQAYTASQLVTTPNSRATVSTVLGIVLTLTEESTEKIYQIPVYDLISANNGGIIRQFDQKRFNLPKSYITILSITSLNLNDSLPINFIYNEIKRTATPPPFQQANRK